MSNLANTISFVQSFAGAVSVPLLQALNFSQSLNGTSIRSFHLTNVLVFDANLNGLFPDQDDPRNGLPLIPLTRTTFIYSVGLNEAFANQLTFFQTFNHS